MLLYKYFIWDCGAFFLVRQQILWSRVLAAFPMNTATSILYYYVSYVASSHTWESQTLQFSSGEGGIARGCAHGCIVLIM